jgi:UDP-glucose 4-epimerase
VIHLAWLISRLVRRRPCAPPTSTGAPACSTRRPPRGVSALAYASSVGAYSLGPKDRRLDESWPTEGIESSFYSRHKAEVERLLDRFEREAPTGRVVRLRPALTFKRDVATGIRRPFAGPFLPSAAAALQRIL